MPRAGRSAHADGTTCRILEADTEHDKVRTCYDSLGARARDMSRLKAIRNKRGWGVGWWRRKERDTYYHDVSIVPEDRKLIGRFVIQYRTWLVSWLGYPRARFPAYHPTNFTRPTPLPPPPPPSPAFPFLFDLPFPFRFSRLFRDLSSSHSVKNRFKPLRDLPRWWTTSLRPRRLSSTNGLVETRIAGTFGLLELSQSER